MIGRIYQQKINGFLDGYDEQYLIYLYFSIIKSVITLIRKNIALNPHICSS